MKRYIAGVLLGLSLCTAVNAQVYVRMGPPAVVVEHPARRPGAGSIWVGGYYRCRAGGSNAPADGSG